MQIHRGRDSYSNLVLIVTALFLSAAVTYAQVNSLGIHFLRVQQEKVHVQMLQGTAGNPWQYRILADALIEPWISMLKGMGVRQPESLAFIVFRYLQSVLILLAAGIYYRRLGLRIYPVLLGLSILTWSLSLSLYNSDLSFNVFFDIAFYLLTTILILRAQWIWLVVLMVPAALNRETSLLIPFLVYFAVRNDRAAEGQRRPATVAAAASLAVFVSTFVGLRLYYGNQQYLAADGFYPGLDLLWLNLSRAVTWEQLAITLGIVPIVALSAYRAWPRSLQVFFWVLAPVWFAVHFAGALVAETRLLLVPQALIFIPGVLFAAVGTQPKSGEETDSPA